jgi:phosphoglycolate phosphatase-like HAD superfamily hydrolase
MSIGAVLFDMDGVLASVGSSYREAIIQTAAHFNVSITQEDISIQKKIGNANNDWILSKRLIDSKLNSCNHQLILNFFFLEVILLQQRYRRH